MCVCSVYSIQGQSVQMVSPSSESHQQVVAVGQPLTAQPQGTVVVNHMFTLITVQLNGFPVRLQDLHVSVCPSAHSEEHSVHADAAESGSLSRCLSGNIMAAGFSHTTGTSTVINQSQSRERIDVCSLYRVNCKMALNSN